jgi:aerobic carbon-monoxide dehydrogenase large subunit
MTTRSVIGDRPKRREDLRFLTGRGQYLDDLVFEGLVHAVVLRSPHAHARIERIDMRKARAAPGVLAAVTAEDARADGLQPLRPSAEANAQTGEPFAFALQPILAADKVRYVGEPVALIVAETLAQAFDAAEQVAVDYTPLPAATTAAAARAAGAREITEEAPGNLCFDWRTGATAAVDAAFAAAAHRVELDLDNHRIVTNPMEPRGVIGMWDAERRRYTAYVSSQSIHATRDNTARALGVPPSAVRRSRRMLAVASGPRISSIPSMSWCRGQRSASAAQSNGLPLAAKASSPTTRRATIKRRRLWRSTPMAALWHCASRAQRMSAPIS